MYIDLIVQACGQWPYILEASGINLSYLKNKHGPCPICGGVDRFRFDNKGDRGTFICNQCGAGDGIKLLMLYRRFDFKEALNFVEHCLNYNLEPIADVLKKNVIVQQALKKQDDPDSRRNWINKIWSQSQTITCGDPVYCYLQARGIKLSAFSHNLRYHRNLPYYHDDVEIGTFPAMVAKIQDHNGKMLTLHRTYLGNGCKADVPKPKKLMSPIIKGSSLGGAIRLCSLSNDGTLALAEGIETALAVHIATGLPTWATISAQGMERIILPQGINNILIAADNDHSGTGQKAAAELAIRLIGMGKKVKVIIPPVVGHDFADLLLEGK